MKKTFIAFTIIVLTFVLAGCGEEQEVTQTPDPTGQTQVPVQQQQEEDVAESDIDEEILLQMEQNAAKDEQIEKDQELFHKMGQEGELTIEDCNKLEDPDFRAGCIEMVELESGAE